MPAPATARRTRIAPSSGTAFRLRKGQRLKVIDPEGEQVSDLLCYADEDRREWLSSGRTFDYESTLLPTTGNTLWSNRSRRMLRIVEDTCGRHDFLLTPCSPEMYRILYGITAASTFAFFIGLQVVQILADMQLNLDTTSEFDIASLIHTNVYDIPVITFLLVIVIIGSLIGIAGAVATVVRSAEEFERLLQSLSIDNILA